MVSNCIYLQVPAGAAVMGRSSNPDHIGGFEVALPIFKGIESKFGLVLPKFETGYYPVHVKKQ